MTPRTIVCHAQLTLPQIRAPVLPTKLKDKLANIPAEELRNILGLWDRSPSPPLQHPYPHCDLILR